MNDGDSNQSYRRHRRGVRLLRPMRVRVGGAWALIFPAGGGREDVSEAVGTPAGQRTGGLNEQECWRSTLASEGVERAQPLLLAAEKPTLSTDKGTLLD
ncbi:hypothetical protein MHYP_G00110420 [Metynnis hypsauchen]